MSERVYILGGFQTDFSRNYAREGLGLDAILSDTVEGALQHTDLNETDIEVFHIGNFIGELMAHQGHLGGFVSELFPAFGNIPASRHEAACASGGIAMLSAMSDILSGRYATAAVAGIELEKNKSGAETADHLGVAAWYDKECQGIAYPWPKLFSDVGDAYEERYGLNHEYLAELSKSHYANARRNPNAQTRGWELDADAFDQDDASNPVVTGRIRKRDCSQITDGGAMVVLANREKAEAYASSRNMSLSAIPFIQGWGHTTGPISLQAKWHNAIGNEYLFPHLHRCLSEAMGRAGLQNVFDLDAIETHDCFTTSAYMAIDHFGITPPGRNWVAIEEGWLKRNGRLPMNPSGGLIGGGHPVGATGVRMVLDSYKQVTGTASDYQVEGCSRMATLNIGGSVTTCVSFVIGDDRRDNT